MKNKNQKAFNRQDLEKKIPEQNENHPTIPIHSYWFFAIMVIIASSMFVKHNTADIQFQDNHYVIYFHHLTIAISLLLLIFGFIYWSLRNKPLTKWMINFHSLLTLVTIGTFYMTCFKESTWNITPVFLLGVGLLVVAQVILVLNIFQSKRSE